MSLKAGVGFKAFDVPSVALQFRVDSGCLGVKVAGHACMQAVLACRSSTPYLPCGGRVLPMRHTFGSQAP